MGFLDELFIGTLRNKKVKPKKQNSKKNIDIEEGYTDCMGS